MPKLLILFHARSADLAPLVDALADGARSVRFAEVDVRCLGEGGDAHGGRKQLEQVDALATYDGIVLGVPSDPEDQGDLLAGFARFGGSLTDKVGSAFTARGGADRAAALWSALTPMADRGMILVPAPFTEPSSPAVEACRRVGKRVAEVIGWVTHARSHHHDHHHHH